VRSDADMRDDWDEGRAEDATTHRPTWRSRGRWVLLCDSSSQGSFCERPYGHRGVHRTWTDNVSWGTSQQLSETLEGTR
jgi:hypothetical protein